jgi:hypothetical protein
VANDSYQTNQIFRKQGLDFADFILHQKDPKVVESTLPEVIANVLESAGVHLKAISFPP